MKRRILAYHRISAEPAAGLETWAIEPAVFRRQMRLLQRLGFRGVAVRELLDAVDAGDTGQKLIGISFDDGYLDTVEAALPILAEVGFTASVYVVPRDIGRVTSWESAGQPAPLAGWDELSRLVDAGWELGMHSHSHPARFDLLAGDELRSEVRCGVTEIQRRLDTVVDTFAYPHGHFSVEAVRALRDAGYRAAVTTEPGALAADADPHLLPRYELKRRDTLAEFALMLLTGTIPRRKDTILRFMPARVRNIVRSRNSSGGQWAQDLTRT